MTDAWVKGFLIGLICGGVAVIVEWAIIEAVVMPWLRGK